MIPLDGEFIFFREKERDMKQRLFHKLTHSNGKSKRHAERKWRRQFRDSIDTNRASWGGIAPKKSKKKKGTKKFKRFISKPNPPVERYCIGPILEEALNAKVA